MVSRWQQFWYHLLGPIRLILWARCRLLNRCENCWDNEPDMLLDLPTSLVASRWCTSCFLKLKRDLIDRLLAETKGEIQGKPKDVDE